MCTCLVLPVRVRVRTLGTLKSVEVEYGGVEYEVDGDDRGAKEVLYGALR